MWLQRFRSCDRFLMRAPSSLTTNRIRHTRVPVIRIVKDWFNPKHGRTLGPEVGGATIDRSGYKSRPRGKPHRAT